jgi:hypothetical protein
MVVYARVPWRYADQRLVTLKVTSTTADKEASIALSPFGAKTGREQSQQARAYSITSSAATSRPGGTARPSAFAVLRLIMVSYLVGACTGGRNDSGDFQQ